MELAAIDLYNVVGSEDDAVLSISWLGKVHHCVSRVPKFCTNLNGWGVVCDSDLKMRSVTFRGLTKSFDDKMAGQSR